MTDLQIRVLGEVEAVGPGGRAVLTGTRRVILGALALRAGRVVSFDGLVDVVWGHDPPRTATKTLHSHVARLRQALAAVRAAPVVSTRDLGYVLEVPRDHVDAHRFEFLVTAARAKLARGERDGVADTLRTALELWRGEPFDGTELGEWGQHELHRLRQLWLSATEDLWDVEIDSGGAAAAAVELPQLVARHPVRERLTGLLMRALYRCGRHTEALTAFDGLRRLLAAEIGADPSPELAELHTAILRHSAELQAPAASPAPDPPRAPAQLPAKPGHFIGRDTELAVLDAVCAGDELLIVVISGPAGMGKTATAVQWASANAARFCDGQLFLDLRGHDPDHAMTAEQALAQLLGGLGVPEDRIPAGVPARSALYRTMLHGKQCVVLLDNAGSVDQILPLVPAAATVQLVITSRVSLASLGAHHAVRHVVLDALDDDNAVTLLTRVLGADRVGREPTATARLATLCAGMPLALRITAARLACHPGRSIAEAADDLAVSRLDGFEVDGDARTVRGVLTSAYRPLSDTARRLLRCSATVPAPTVSGHLGATLAGLDDEQARRAFDELSGAHLVLGTGGHRFRFHDLIREFASDRAVAEETAPDRVRDRLIDWYLFVAAEANRLINPHRDAVEPELALPAPPLPFAGRQAAIRLLEVERHGFLPVARYATEQGRPVAAWQLVYLLTSFYEVSGHWTERVELCQAGVAAATAAGSQGGVAEMLRALGVSYYMTRRLNEAVDTALTALDVVRAAGDLAGEGHVLNNLANAYADLRRFDEASTAFERAIETSTAAGNRLGVALSQRNLGHALVRMGRAAESLAPLRTALSAFDDLGNARLRAGTLNTLGEAHRDLGNYEQALADLTEALAISRNVGDRWLEWELLRDVGVTRLAAGDTAAALTHFEQSLAVTRVVGDRNGEAVALCLIGRTHLVSGHLGAAARHLEQARAVRAQVPDAYEEAHVYRALAELAAARGDDAAEVAHRDRAVSLYRQVNATEEAEISTP